MGKQIILLIILGLVIFALGGGLGFFYKAQQLSSPLAFQAPQQSLGGAAAGIKILSSSAFPSIIAIGKVQKVFGRVITLNYGGQSVDIPVQDGAKIYSLAFSAGTKITSGSPQTESTFGAIKVGDNLSISVKVSTDGKVEGTSVIILPASK